MSTSKPSKNAVSHGADSKDVLLPWENEQDFKNLHESLEEELSPDAGSEEAAVFDLACLHWKKRTAEHWVSTGLPPNPRRKRTGRCRPQRLGRYRRAFRKALDNNESTRDTMRSIINKAFGELMVKGSCTYYHACGADVCA